MTEQSWLIVQNCPAESPAAITDYLSSRRIPFQVMHSYRQEAFPDPEQHAAVIALGCPLSMTRYRETPYLVELYAFLSQVIRAGTPLLGICFGAQMTAHILGAKVEPNRVKEIGVGEISLTDSGKADPLSAPLGESAKVFQWHGDTFRIPYGAQHLASSVLCRNQAFRRGNVVGLQFHLEVTESEVKRWCDEYRSELDELGLTADKIIGEYRTKAEDIAHLNRTFLEGFATLVTTHARKPAAGFGR